MSKHPDTTACRSSWINPIFTGTKNESWYCQEHKESVWPNKDSDPSSSLHTKLQTILDAEVNNPIREGEGVDPKDYFGIDTDDIIAQILQAFQEAGYIQAHSLPKGIYNATGHSLNQISAEAAMTGPEWFSRFKAELDSGLALPEPMRLWVLKCAEVAAGIA